MLWELKKWISLRLLGHKAMVEIIAREEGDEGSTEVRMAGDAHSSIFGLAVALSRSTGELLAQSDMDDATADQRIAEICEELKNTMRYKMQEARARRHVRHTDGADA